MLLTTLPRMKNVLCTVAAFGMLISAAQAADSSFTTALTPQEYAAAGLNKLTPDEVARLDRLVGAYQSGALAAAQRELAAAQAAKADAEARAAKAQSEAMARNDAKGHESWLGKAKAILTPGTIIEYRTLDSQIVGNVKGWHAETVFRLENGQLWRVLDGESYWSAKVLQNPKIQITPGKLGGFWMKIEGIRAQVRVAPLVTK